APLSVNRLKPAPAIDGWGAAQTTALRVQPQRLPMRGPPKPAIDSAAPDDPLRLNLAAVAKLLRHYGAGYADDGGVEQLLGVGFPLIATGAEDAGFLTARQCRPDAPVAMSAGCVAEGIAQIIQGDEIGHRF